MPLLNNFSLTEDEVDELVQNTVFKEAEIELLYNRFTYLDRSNSGFITYADLQMIPEFDANPFSRLIIAYLERLADYKQINFHSFLQFLSLFSDRNDRTNRISFLFEIFDLNNNGKLSRQVIFKIYEMLLPDSVDDQEIKKVFILYDRNKNGYLSKGDFIRLYNDDPSLERTVVINFNRRFGTLKNTGFWGTLWPSGSQL